MKKLLLTGFIICLMFNCYGRGFKITGEIRNFKGSKVDLIITKVHGDRTVQPIQIPVKNGIFTYEGEVVSPYMSSLAVEGKSLGTFILYNEEIKITTDVDNISSFSVNGGVQCDQYNEYQRTILPIEKQMGELRGEMRSVQGAPKEKELNEKFNTLLTEYHGMISDFIVKYPESGTSSFLLWKIYSATEISTAIELYNKLDDKVLADNSYFKFISPTMIGQKTYSAGNKIPSMSQRTPDGKLISLDDYRGKYLLIDFWASWCAPCRAANPDVVELYNKYKDKNFAILGISLDRDENNWIEAIAKDGLTWDHVSDLKYWNNEISREFGVNSIPATILVDPDGIIVGRNLHKYQLEEILKERLGPINKNYGQ